MTSEQVLSVLYATMTQCSAQCMDDDEDREIFANTFALLLRRAQEQLDGEAKRIAIKGKVRR